MSEYQQQKNVAETYTTIIEITEAKEWPTNISIKARDGKTYSHFKNEKHGEWAKLLKEGNIMGVFVRKVTKGDRTFLNIYPDINHQEPIPRDEYITEAN